MPKIARHLKKKAINDAQLRQLWASRMTEADIAKTMGHKPWVLRRRAVKIGLPSSRRKLWAEKGTRT
jgi:hypothetical protein